MPFRIIILVLLIITAPYLSAMLAAGTEHTFGGFLLNPVDGNSYLAKMYQGWRGDWKFTLPFSANPGSGAYLYTYYLFLGHLARGLRLPLIVVFHLARLLNAVALLCALWWLMKASNLSRNHTMLAYTLACLGLGMGWLAFPFGVATSDFWVAEAYPFLSVYISPHFTLSLALMVWLLTFTQSAPGKMETFRFWSWSALVAFVLTSVVLASLSPFAVVLCLTVLLTLLLWEIVFRWYAGRSFSRELPEPTGNVLAFGSIRAIFIRLVCILLGGAPVVLYEIWVVRADATLATWNSQNLTPSPPIWDLFLAFSPVLWLALIGIRQAWQRGVGQSRILLIWSFISFMMVLLPLGLQRRFLVGLAIPLAGLAGFGLEALENRFGKRLKLVKIASLVLTFPTLLLVILLGQFGALTHDPLLYLTRGEAQALTWLETNTPPQALVLAGSQTGLFIPAYTGRRVLYGHPFETVNANAEKAAVTSFFMNAAIDPIAARSFLEDRCVDYVFYGTREQNLGELPVLPGLSAVYSQAGVTIYQAASP